MVFVTELVTLFHIILFLTFQIKMIMIFHLFHMFLFRV